MDKMRGNTLNLHMMRSTCEVKNSKKLLKNKRIFKNGQVHWNPHTFFNKNGKFHENPASASKTPKCFVRVTFENEVPRAHFCLK